MSDQNKLFEPGPAREPGSYEPPFGEQPAPKLKPINREQKMLAMIDIEELIAPDHPARAIWDLAGRLDLSGYEEKIRSVEGGSGRPAWNPRLLVSVWVYALSEGFTKAREIERVMQYEPGLQWLSGLQTINYHTLADFAVEGGEALQQLFVELLGLLEAEGILNLERVMHDGTKVRAQASSGSFRREKTVREHLERARQVVEKMGDPGEPESGKPSRREAAQQRAARERKERVARAWEQLQQIQQDQPSEEDRAEARVSLTDPDARIMKQGDGGFAPAYNVQISTDAERKIIVGVQVSQVGSDYEQLAPAVERIQQNLTRTPKQIVVDGGYTSAKNIVRMAEKKIDLIGSLGDEDARTRAAMQRLGIDPQFRPQAFARSADGNSLQCPAGQTLVFVGRNSTRGYRYQRYRAPGQACRRCKFQPRCCPRQPEQGRLVSMVCEPPEVRAFREKMASEPARSIYRQRAGVAETPHAWIKEKFGIRQFRLRGLARVRWEAWWACLTYNIMQWVRIVWRKAQPASA